jgi:peptide/nickel transport system substrate-binding protein
MSIQNKGGDCSMNRRENVWFLLILLVVLSMVITACEPATSEPTEAQAPTTEMEEPTEKPEEPPAETEEPVVATEAPPAGEGPLYGGTLVWALDTSLSTCNPATITHPTWLSNVYDHLMLFNANFEMQPELALSYEILDDGKQIVFHLREGVKWHDGEPFTSADVKFTWENALMTIHPRGKKSNAVVESVETPDDYTVTFNLSAPSPGFLFQIGIGESPIIPKHIFENEDVVEGPHATCEELPIGTGPFKAVDFEPGVSMTMERNADWWGTEGNYWGVGQPYLDQLIGVIIPDENARINGFETGDITFLVHGMLPADQVARFEEMDGRDVTQSCAGVPVHSTYFFNLRREDQPYADVNVRKAISWALDRDAINEKVYFGIGIPNWTFLPPDHPDFHDGLTTYYPRDLEKAEQMLDDAGYPRGEDGIRFEISISAYDWANTSGLAEVFKQQLEDVGIMVNLDISDFNSAVDKIFIQHDFDVGTVQYGVNDPGVGVARLFITSNIGEAPFNNASAYSNPEMDELWETYNSTFDQEVRHDAMLRIQEIANEEMPLISVNTPTNWMSMNTDQFAGWQTDCIGMQHLAGRMAWWKEGRPTP